MFSFTIFFHSPNSYCSFVKRDRARPNMGRLVQRGNGRREGGGMCIEKN